MRTVLLVFLLLFVTSGVQVNGHYYANAAWDNKTMKQDVYRKIYKLGYKGNYVITGEAKPEQGYFFYSVEDGHVQFFHEKRYELKGNGKEWKHFKIMINIPETALPDNGSVILTLYEHNAKGKIIRSFPVVLEQFYH